MSGTACTTCNGMGHGRVEPRVGWIGGGDPVPACPDCNPKGKPRPASAFAPRKSKMITAEGIDGPLPPDWESQRPMTAQEAGFSPSEIARQNAADLAAMQKEGIGRKR